MSVYLNTGKFMRCIIGVETNFKSVAAKCSCAAGANIDSFVSVRCVDKGRSSNDEIICNNSIPLINYINAVIECLTGIISCCSGCVKA